MANEWKSYRLEELCEFINGFAFKSTDYVPPFSDTIEVFRMGYIQRGGGFKEDDSPVFVPRKYGRNLEKYFLKPGDVTIAMTDMKDRVAILGNTAWIRDAGRFVVNQRVGCMRVSRPDLLDPRFLYFYSNWSPHVDYLRSRANSGVQVNLSTSAIKDSELTIPPLAEQKAIAAVLGALDDKIELSRRMNATLEAMARALFQSWFVDFDPVRAKLDGRPPAALDPATAALFPEHLEESTLGHIPKGWEGAELGQIAHVIDCLHAKKPERCDAGQLYLQLNNIRDDGLIDITDSFFVGAEDYQKWISRMEAVAGDCVITNVGRVGAVGQIPEGVKAALGRNITGIRCKAEFPFPTFLIECLVSESMREEIRLKTDSGTILDALNVKSIPKLRFVRPTREIGARFEELTRPVRRRMEQNISESRTLATLRDTLLPKLLSGELSVTELQN